MSLFWYCNKRVCLCMRLCMLTLSRTIRVNLLFCEFKDLFLLKMKDKNPQTRTVVKRRTYVKVRFFLLSYYGPNSNKNGHISIFEEFVQFLNLSFLGSKSGGMPLSSWIFCCNVCAVPIDNFKNQNQMGADF